MKTNSFNEITHPTFLVDKKRVIKNIQQFQKKFSRSNTIFRPHFKTHQSTLVGSWFQELGIHQISVSSVAMAWQFYQAGWKDISIVFPFNRLEIALLQEMSKDATIGILIEDLESVNFLSSYITNNLNIYIKVDCGYGRTGIEVTNHKLVLKIAQLVNNSSKLHFKGILSHFGNTYSARNNKEVKQIYNNSLEKMIQLKEELIKDFPDVMISIGDTPSVSIIKDFTGVDEMRPGNFVFYDWMQTEIGSCSTDKIAAIMLCPVVAKHKKRNEIIIHGGAVHFSKERGNKHFGGICDISEGFGTQVIPNCYIKSLSQEHGIVHCSESFFEDVSIGDLIGIIPIHSCLTANLMKENTLIISGSL